MKNPIMPNCSKSELDRAGDTIRKSNPSDSDYTGALNLINAWREAHTVPTNSFKASVSRIITKRYDNKNKLVAGRLKRLPTIVDKLSRQPKMSISRMQDFGGVRVVLGEMSEVEELTNYLSKTKLLHFRLKRVVNYINEPRESGYRCIHLIFEFDTKRPDYKQYNGLYVELQIRTLIQHDWATAVESVGIVIGNDIKSGRGTKMWENFFVLSSMAFAQAEQTPLLSSYRNQKPAETYDLVKRFDKKHSMLKTLRGMFVAINVIKEDELNGYYHLINLDKSKNRVRITTYRKNVSKKALDDYKNAETLAKSTGEEVVLVSVTQINKLKQAYPNFFLDVKDFQEKIEVLLET